jgi:NAD(P)-dependent dehydrogenase (short-subunit alcohol dehydrogenase family)
MRLSEKVAIVTGAGSGIGEAIAHRLAQEGARVLVADLNLSRARKLCALFEAEGLEVAPFKVDVRQDDEVKAMIDHAIDRFGELDILVNNAGVGKSGYLDEILPEAWDLVLDTNLKSLYLTSRHAIPHLKKRPGGRIINIASVEGLRGTGVTPAYTASKHAVVGLTRSLALALAPYQVTANAICPGFIVTRMTRTILAVPEFGEACRRAVPLGRLGSPQDVAAAAAFLASRDAEYITGHTLVVDGGMTVGVGLELPDRL